MSNRIDYDVDERDYAEDERQSGIFSEIKRKSQQRKENSNALLEEFSDDTNSFYVDERKEKRQERKRASAEKKIAKKQAPKKPKTPLQRKIRRIVSCCVIVAVVLCACVVLSLTVLFKTENYEVIGNTLSSESEIISACPIKKGENIFLSAKGYAEREIKKKFPYIEDVKISAKIPDTITINITEAVPSYIVKISDKEYFVVSSKGRILEKTEDISKINLPIFIGPTAKTAEVGSYIEYEDDTIVEIIENISTIFSDNGYQGITEIDASNPAELSFTYDNRIKVKLGMPEDLSYKIRTAMTIITEKIDVNKANKVEGELDVSRCNETKKSYFNEKPLLQIDSTKDKDDKEKETTENGEEAGQDNQEEQKSLPIEQWYVD
ncbi:MAG: FtsQ-type POTRA domain-containing protein [Oscillospiraceae bacterium]|nr:FtsQ-type POTRA domain-containing protein [Candidatus Ruminococcus equi]